MTASAPCSCSQTPGQSSGPAPGKHAGQTRRSNASVKRVAIWPGDARCKGSGSAVLACTLLPWKGMAYSLVDDDCRAVPDAQGACTRPPVLTRQPPPPAAPFINSSPTHTHTSPLPPAVAPCWCACCPTGLGRRCPCTGTTRPRHGRPRNRPTAPRTVRRRPTGRRCPRREGSVRPTGGSPGGPSTTLRPARPDKAQGGGGEDVWLLA